MASDFSRRRAVGIPCTCITNSMFSCAVSTGMRLYAWNTKPMFARRRSASSTLLNAIGGLAIPDSGEGWVADKRIDQMSKGELAATRRRHQADKLALFDLDTQVIKRF